MSLLRLLLTAFFLTTAFPLHAQPLPDLVPEASSIRFDYQTFVDQGDVLEGCAAATSGVDLLRFSVLTRNVGLGDFALGDPQCPDCSTHPNEQCGNPLFHCSPAGGHDHPHYTNYARYELLDAANTVVGVSGKFGFCLTDTFCTGGATPHYTCEDQGLTAGCSDLYWWGLGCQYIDVTTVANGDYTLRVIVDPLSQIVEADETNNVITMPVTLARGPSLEGVALHGQRAVLAARRNQPTHRLRVETKPETTFSLPLVAQSPMTLGATLQFLDTDALGSATVVFLPAENWVGLGSPIGSKGYKYVGKPQQGDECFSVELKQTGVAAVCNTLSSAPSLPIQGQLKLQLRIGDGTRRFCALFGGDDVVNTPTSFRRKNAPAAPCD